MTIFKWSLLLEKNFIGNVVLLWKSRDDLEVIERYGFSDAIPLINEVADMAFILTLALCWLPAICDPCAQAGTFRSYVYPIYEEGLCRNNKALATNMKITIWIPMNGAAICWYAVMVATAANQRRNWLSAAGASMDNVDNEGHLTAVTFIPLPRISSAIDTEPAWSCASNSKLNVAVRTRWLQDG